MSDIVFNEQAKEKEVKRCFDDSLKKIKDNAANGIALTELYLPVHVMYDVRQKLREYDEKIDFKTLYTSTQYLPGTGGYKTVHHTLERRGDEAFMAVKYYH